MQQQYVRVESVRLKHSLQNSVVCLMPMNGMMRCQSATVIFCHQATCFDAFSRWRLYVCQYFRLEAVDVRTLCCIQCDVWRRIVATVRIIYQTDKSNVSCCSECILPAMICPILWLRNGGLYCMQSDALQFTMGEWYTQGASCRTKCLVGWGDSIAKMRGSFSSV